MKPRRFVLYGLDSHSVSLTENFEAADLAAAAAVGRARLPFFERIEVWDGPVCIYRERRNSGGAAKRPPGR